MSAYLIVKALHVAGAVIWVGGDFACLTLSMRAMHRRDIKEFMQLMPSIKFVTQFLAMPASLTALVCGIAMVIMSWDFSQLWIILGLLGFAIVLISGVGFLRSHTEQLTRLYAADGPTDEVKKRAGEILRLVKLDHLVMFVVIADMVLKPTIDDRTTWFALLGATVLIGGYVLSRRGWKPETDNGVSQARL